MAAGPLVASPVRLILGRSHHNHYKAFKREYFKTTPHFQLPSWSPVVLGLLAGLLTVASGLWLEPCLQAWGLFHSLENICRCFEEFLSLPKTPGLPPSYCSLSTHGVPALVGSLAGLVLAGLAEEKTGTMQV